MGIMPADRDQKWQRVFRRFGLPGDVAEKQPAVRDQDRQDKRGQESPERDQPAKKKSSR